MTQQPQMADEQLPHDDRPVTVSFTVPAQAMRAVRTTPPAFTAALRLAAAMFWHGRAEVSISTAAALAGMSQAQFMHALTEAKLDTVVLDPDDLDREIDALIELHAPGQEHG